jgi:hypothetical protein
MDGLVPPPFDPESGAIWRSVYTELMGERPLILSAETLGLSRDASAGKDDLLADRAVTHRDITIPGPAGELTLAVFGPEDPSPKAPGMLWIHGGGMVSGSRWSSREALDLVIPAGGIVASVEYRLAPESPAPAPFDDCTAALRWVDAHCSTSGSIGTLCSWAGAVPGEVWSRPRPCGGEMPVVGRSLDCSSAARCWTTG